MEYNFLSPNCGLKVSAICLGAMTFQKKASEFLMSDINIGQEASFKILDKYVELGGNFIDTANIYSQGQSEEIVGEWMKERGNRRDIVLATKVRWGMNALNPELHIPNNRGLSRKHILDAVEDSLKRLQTDYIDLYQIHGPDCGTPTAEIVKTLDGVIRSGKVRYIGACNMSGWQMQKLVDVTRELNCNPFVTLQSHYSLLGRTSEPEAFTVCKNEGLGVLPWGALDGGLLTGKFKKGDTKPPEGSRMELGTKLKLPTDNMPDMEKFLHDEKFWAVMETMEKIAKKHDKKVSQVAIRWLLQMAPVTSVIIGTTKVHQLEDNMGAVGWRMTDEEMAELTKLTDPLLPYPYNMMAMMSDGRDKCPAYV